MGFQEHFVNHECLFEAKRKETSIDISKIDST